MYLFPPKGPGMHVCFRCWWATPASSESEGMFALDVTVWYAKGGQHIVCGVVPVVDHLVAVYTARQESRSM